MAVSIEDLARRTGAVIEEVANSGKPAVVTDHGLPVVEIVPLSKVVDPCESDVLKLFGGYGAYVDTSPLGRSVVDEFIAERRAEQACEDAS